MEKTETTWLRTASKNEYLETLWCAFAFHKQKAYFKNIIDWELSIFFIVDLVSLFIIYHV